MMRDLDHPGFFGMSTPILLGVVAALSAGSLIWGPVGFALSIVAVTLALGVSAVALRDHPIRSVVRSAAPSLLVALMLLGLAIF